MIRIYQRRHAFEFCGLCLHVINEVEIVNWNQIVEWIAQVISAERSQNTPEQQ